MSSESTSSINRSLLSKILGECDNLNKNNISDNMQTLNLQVSNKIIISSQSICNCTEKHKNLQNNQYFFIEEGKSF